MLFNKKKGADREGFTLIEILIVVAIIGILASIVLVGLGPAQKQGRDARRLSDLRQAQTGLELYFHKCGFYPGPAEPDPSCTVGFSAIDGSAGSTDGASWSAMNSALAGSDIGIPNGVPDDPVRTMHYSYGSVAPGTSYTLGTTLEGPNTALDNDIDGTSNTVVCQDPVYCVQL